MFTYNETKGNLFDYEEEYALAQWIGADFDSPTGLAASFESRYGTSRDLKKLYRAGIWLGKGFCRISNNKNILNLITTGKYYEVPAKERIKEALMDMRRTMLRENMKRVAMPKISGIDWQEVHDLIFDVFSGDDVEIRVVYEADSRKLNIIDPDMEKNNFGKDRRNIDGNTEKKYY